MRTIGYLGSLMWKPYIVITSLWCLYRLNSEVIGKAYFYVRRIDRRSATNGGDFQTLNSTDVAWWVSNGPPCGVSNYSQWSWFLDICLLEDVGIVTALHETMPCWCSTIWEHREIPLYRDGRPQDEATMTFSGWRGFTGLLHTHTRIIDLVHIPCGRRGVCCTTEELSMYDLPCFSRLHPFPTGHQSITATWKRKLLYWIFLLFIMTSPDEVDIIVAGGLHYSMVIAQNLVACLNFRRVRWLRCSRPFGCTWWKFDSFTN